MNHTSSFLRSNGYNAHAHADDGNADTEATGDQDRDMAEAESTSDSTKSDAEDEVEEQEPQANAMSEEDADDEQEPMNREDRELAHYLHKGVTSDAFLNQCTVVVLATCPQDSVAFDLERIAIE